jgi:hypothetical protein
MRLMTTTARKTRPRWLTVALLATADELRRLGDRVGAIESLSGHDIRENRERAPLSEKGGRRPPPVCPPGDGYGSSAARR